jgi:uncharacterized protein DUF3326
MLLIEKEFQIPVREINSGILDYLSKSVNAYMGPNEIPIRFVVTKSDEDYYCELGLITGDNNIKAEYKESIFDFKHREYENNREFNAVLVIPTGIGAEIGGHDGDAGPVAKLLASLCDNLITHPNVVNASDINEIPENGWYVEGSVISRLLMGTIGLQKARSNRVLVAIESCKNKIFVNAAINSVNAARATYGFRCPKVIQLEPSVKLRSEYTSSGRATGAVQRFECLKSVLDEHNGDYDAVAIASIIDVPKTYHRDYFRLEGEMVNPWGGVEAILTHAVSLLYNIPSAHAPMFESEEIADIDPGVVDPRMAAEAVSTTFLQCILKGLQRSPKIVKPGDGVEKGVMTVSDISCLVIPNGCIGLPTLAALEQGIPVIAVKENKNLMNNDLTLLPWNNGQLQMVENYWEAAGLLCALKSGIAPESVRRPLLKVNVDKKSLSSNKITEKQINE